MSRAAAQRIRIKGLERKRANLESQLGSLVRKRQCLLLHNAILTAWCDALTLVQASWGIWMAAPANPAAAAGAAATAAAARQDDEAMRERFQQLLKEEVTLLNELTVRDRVSVCAVGSAATLPDPGPNTLSPGDPMSRFRTVMAEGPCPEAAGWTMQEVASMLRETVLLTSLHLNLHQSGPDAACSSKQLEAVKELWDRYIRAVMSLIMMGRQDVVQALSSYNLETLDHGPEHGEAAAQVTGMLPARMKFTELQKEVTSAACEAYDSLQTSLRQQWLELTAQMGAAAAAAEAAAATDKAEWPDVGSNKGLSAQEAAPAVAAAAEAEAPAAAAVGQAAAAGSTSGSSGRVLRDLSRRQEHLEVQQQLAARMKLVTAKQYLLLITMTSLICGCLTYEQVTLMHVMTWPYAIRPLHLGKEIAKFAAQESASSLTPAKL